MDYAYAVKTLPPPAADPAADPAAPPPPEPQPPQQDDARPWAGDVYDEGDESDPAEAYAGFSGQNGEQAWLDKAEDGTLTGWVRDETGQVWRYSDPDAWAIDVDDAGMTQTGGGEGAAPDADTGQDPGAEPAADGAEAAPLDFAPADAPVEPGGDDPGLVPGEGDDPEADPAEEDEDPEEGEALEEDEEEIPKGKKGGKPWA
ncbi:hypothetical protein HFP70_35820 [Streptomyces sp. ARC14]|uniref:hypothetical protein n=1 Tax=Streptomyces sp. ARC14 TaxID=2724152 RepID=UPI0038575BC1